MRLELARLTVCGLLCACGTEPHGYEITVEVVGTPQAFSGRDIRVEGQIARPAGAWQDPALQATEVMLCTEDEQVFLHTPVRVAVLEGSRVLADVQLERVACLYREAKAMQYREWNRISLLDSGALVTEIGADPNVGARCFDEKPLPRCGGRPLLE